MLWAVGVIVVFSFIIYMLILSILNSGEQRDEIIIADCKQLLVIYLNDDNKYQSISEQLAKKHYDVKCNAYSPSEADRQWREK